MRLDESVLGRRVSVRRRVPGEAGPTGGPAMTDVIGRVVAIDDSAAQVERRDGTLVDVRLADVVFARQVPDGPQRGRTRPATDHSPEALARVCTRGWPPVESEPLGEWLLRASGGFTSRANSVAVHGEPGVGVPEALDRVAAYYADRGLPAKAQVIEGSRWEEALADAGWAGIGGTHDHALVQVADLRDALPAAHPATDVEVVDSADDDWLAMYGRATGVSAEVARRVLEGPPAVGFVRIGDPLAAIGRVSVTGEWAGMTCVEVQPSHRRQGLGRRVVDASLHWASRHGADKAYLQTVRHNTAALGLYAAYGFRDHHAYRYLTPAADARHRVVRG